jgi:hypothetical protein
VCLTRIVLLSVKQKKVDTHATSHTHSTGTHALHPLWWNSGGRMHVASHTHSRETHVLHLLWWNSGGGMHAYSHTHSRRMHRVSHPLERNAMKTLTPTPDECTEAHTHSRGTRTRASQWCASVVPGGLARPKYKSAVAPIVSKLMSPRA